MNLNGGYEHVSTPSHRLPRSGAPGLFQRGMALREASARASRSSSFTGFSLPRRMRAIAALLALSLVTVPSCASDDEPVTAPFPQRIVAIGDSITRATNACCLPGDQPRRSWSVGDLGGDVVRSHLERIAGVEPGVRVRAFNVAQAGATVSDLARQAATAVRRRAEYVTILVGANDACRSPMTPVEALGDRFGAAMDLLEDGLPRARVFVASTPNVVRLWRLFGDDPRARLMWRTAATCPPILSDLARAADRRAVLAQLRRYNAVFRRACAAHPRCRFDGGVVFRYPFTAEEVSAVDYFHPSIEGQAALARITWGRSWWA